MEELDEKIKKVMKNKIQEPLDYEQKILNTIRKSLNRLETKEKGGRNFIMKKQIIATACASFILVSGIALASNIENIKNHFNRGLGEGMQTAIDNGYIAKPEMEFVKVDNIGARVKIEDFVMDDLNLSTNFIFEFDETITNTINMEKINNIELSDLIVRDEENRIIYSSSNKEAFEKYCKENNLNYTFSEFNENYMNNGLNAFIVNKNGNNVKVMYNMYTSNTFPKSKKLYFSFETITLIKYTGEKQTKYELKGIWNTTVDVPKEMYNRTEEYYKVESCDNEDFEVYTAKVTNTGFEFGVIISNIEKPKKDIKKSEEFNIALREYHNGNISEDEYNQKALWNKEYNDLLNPIQVADFNYVEGKNGKASYVENENEYKFKSTLSPSRRAKTYFLEENKYDFYETFEMTKYDASNRVKVVLYYYGEPVTIELEKVN